MLWMYECADHQECFSENQTARTEIPLRIILSPFDHDKSAWIALHTFAAELKVVDHSAAEAIVQHAKFRSGDWGAAKNGTHGSR